MKNLSLNEFTENFNCQLLNRNQMKKIKGGLLAKVICRNTWQKTLGGLRVTRWSCNNSEGDFYSYSRMEDGLWREKSRLNLNGWEW